MKYQIDKLINTLVADLTSRQKDILSSRFGLNQAKPMTLAKIGEKYSITRERVRQVELLALNSVRAKFARGSFSDLVKDLQKHFNKLGGVQKEAVLCEDLKKVIGSEKANNYNNKIKFILQSSGVFNRQSENKDYHAFWYVNDSQIKKANDLIIKLSASIKNKKDDLIINNKFDDVFVKTIKSCGCPRHLALNYVAVSKKFANNAYNDFGLSSWTEINPKTSRDWAYLVLKKKNAPMHFTELTTKINLLRKNKITNPQTVHNELIKDGRFVLVGRGTYGLKEFNLMAGTAREVISQILRKHGPQESRGVIKLVLEQRMFKENTLLLNLQDRSYFRRLDDGRYMIKKA
jgi:hypothetical protein